MVITPALQRVIDELSADSEALTYLAQRGIGIEKEALRVDEQGALMTTPHPPSLGSSLCHPHITTDYSEAQLELITPKLHSDTAAIRFLYDLHAYVYQNCEEKFLLWSNSMPCVLKSGENIPIAEYGKSNAGQMKHIYRQGLKRRYGSAMQAISGVHFNYSLGPQAWQPVRAALCADKQSNDQNDDQTFRDLRYMGMIRNLLRCAWVIPYLFGASPAVCQAFVGGSHRELERFNNTTLFGADATSLRMGSLGYQNNKEIKTGLKVSYNDLAAYISSLRYAVTTPYPAYEAHGVKTADGFCQLNANILQIENEYYATVRPKRTADKHEMSLLALQRAGIEYVELRSLDINPFIDVGVGSAQLCFLEALFVLCLLSDGPPLSDDEQKQCIHNEVIVGHQGRRAGLCLQTPGGERPLREWGQTLCDALTAVAELLDKACGGIRYGQAIAEYRELFIRPEATLSARVLQAMRDQQVGFVDWVLRQTKQHRARFLKHSLSADCQRQWDELAQKSLREQSDLEAADRTDLDAYIRGYFDQLQG